MSDLAGSVKVTLSLSSIAIMADVTRKGHMAAILDEVWVRAPYNCDFLECIETYREEGDTMELDFFFTK